MSKILESPVKRWPGRVVLARPVSLDRYIAWSKSIDEISAVKDGATIGDIASEATLVKIAMPGVLACVEAWELGGDFPNPVTADNFPFIPRISSARLLIALLSSISEIMREEDDLPLH